MKVLRNALLGACLALPITAVGGHAQTIAQGGRAIELPPGAVVVILPALATVNPPEVTATTTPAALPVLRMIARQQAEMARMMAQMNVLLPAMPLMPSPSQVLQTVFGAAGPILALANAPGMCSQSITIVQHGNGAPVITRTQSGCGSAPADHPATIRDLPPVTTPARAPALVQARYARQTEVPPRTLIAER